MPERDTETGHSSRLLRGLIWAGVLLAPLAAAIVLLGDSSGSVRFAVLLIAVSVALIGASVLIRISENGWATSATRIPEQQQQALTTEIDAINADRAQYNVLSYEPFALRDDITGSANIFDQFGIMTDDYTPKPMFSTYRDLVDTLGRR